MPTIGTSVAGPDRSATSAADDAAPTAVPTRWSQHDAARPHDLAEHGFVDPARQCSRYHQR